MEHSAVLLTCIKIPHGFQTVVLSIFEWLLETGFTVFIKSFFKQACVTLSGLCGSMNIPMMPKLPKSLDEENGCQSSTKKDLFTTLTHLGTKYLVMCKVYTDVGGIK